ncbi:very low-density lipoprotein receptor-like [Acanthaster planci]|uniref:Very low-density lipoprotein receptor-like n=1 Tax=Acanthaster planci TaxID=133434 RepID=A0A8B7YW07_ACAPL|nr:very low-density lipoprotein receptor-like [Acanthaster planci]
MTWIIQCVDGQIVRLTFSSFETERDQDYLLAGDGNDITTGQFFVWHGSKSPPNLISSGSEMWIRFTSDFEETSSGFLLLAICLPSTEILTCGENEFNCGHSVCLVDMWQCDGLTDCLDGSDEENCDSEAPTVTCPNTVMIGTDTGRSFATVTWTPIPTATDNTDILTSSDISCLDSRGNVVVSGGTNELGTTTVTCHATDAATNTGSCEFSITVVGKFDI